MINLKINIKIINNNSISKTISKVYPNKKILKGIL